MTKWTAALLAPLVLVALALVAGMLVLLGLAKPTNAAAPNYAVVTVGGLQYQAMNGRQLDPAGPIDAAILRGLPAAERRTPPGQMLYGVFLSVSNGTPRPLRSANRIELLDESNRVYQPLPLAAGDPYAYTPRLVPAGATIPVFGSPAADNLAAEGYLVLFRVPTASFNAGGLEIVIHDPAHPAQTETLFA